jgi:hypothetical protein
MLDDLRPFRLLDIFYTTPNADRVYLVLEWMDIDLARFIEQQNRSATPLSFTLIKVGLFSLQFCFLCIFDGNYNNRTAFACVVDARSKESRASF